MSLLVRQSAAISDPMHPLVLAMTLAFLSSPPTPTPAAAPVTTFVLCAPGYPGSTAEAQATMDEFAAALAGGSGLPKGAMTATYQETEQGGLSELAKPTAAVALVTLPFFVQHATELKLEPRLQAVQNPGGATEVWALVAKKGSVVSPAALADFSLVSTAGYAPGFVRGALASWGRVPDSTKIVASSQVLSAMRRAAAGDKVALLLDGTQAEALPSLPFAADLEVVARSEPLPSALVCSVGQRLAPARWTAIEKGLLGLASQPQVAPVLATMRMARFVPIDAAALSAARRLQGGGR
jgi:hypothetical protein